MPCRAGRPLATLLAEDNGAFGAVVAPLLLERMGIKVGDELLVGNARFRINGTIVTEPDSISDGFGFAPRFLTSRDGLFASGLVATGSLVEHAYKIRFSDPAPAAEAIRERAQAEHPTADGRSAAATARPRR